MTVRITIAVDASDGPVSVDVVGVAACDCGAPAAHHPDCAAVALFEPLRQRAWPWWFRRPRHHRPEGRRRP